ncbi:hypothetical protein AB5I41_11950 [Sphingomonas sp. MMS24-JH45]
MEDSVKAAEVLLDADEDAWRLDAAAPQRQAGPRYGERMMAMTRL